MFILLLLSKVIFGIKIQTVRENYCLRRSKSPNFKMTLREQEYLKNGFAKVLLGIAKGKHDYDKRESIKRREQERDIKRIIKSVNR